MNISEKISVVRDAKVWANHLNVKVNQKTFIDVYQKTFSGYSLTSVVWVLLLTTDHLSDITNVKDRKIAAWLISKSIRDSVRNTYVGSIYQLVSLAVNQAPNDRADALRVLVQYNELIVKTVANALSSKSTEDAKYTNYDTVRQYGRPLGRVG